MLGDSGCLYHVRIFQVRIRPLTIRFPAPGGRMYQSIGLSAAITSQPRPRSTLTQFVK